jgi:hypothetical protein
VALSVSIVYLSLLERSGSAVFGRPMGAYGRAVVTGLGIGAAKICYFYLYTGVAGGDPLPVGISRGCFPVPTDRCSASINAI